MSAKKNISAALVPIALSLGIIGGIFIGKYTGVQKVSPTEEKLRMILDLISGQYVDKINTDSLLDSTIPELLASLDPHSVYIPASELQTTNDELEGSFGGVGIMFQVINDTVNVVEVVTGGPAEAVGILPGDMILDANGKKLSGAEVSNDVVFKTLRGQQGSKVKVNVKRPNSKKNLAFEITRGDIPSHSVDASYMLDSKVGYIKVSKFARNTYSEFLTALVDLKSKGATKYVIDMRGNSGGYMDQAILMANEFLPEGRMIVFTKGRTPENETYAVSDDSGQFHDAEVVVLANEYSASAAEIFAGAIQDNDRGLVIGRRTFGKGLVQNQIALPDSSAIRLTVARYFVPSGRSIQKEYKRGADGKYQMDIVNRYNNGEFYSQDSIHLDKSKKFTTLGGRTVYGGGGIMPDIFVPEDTIGITSYYIEVMNQGLIQKFARELAKTYRPMLRDKKSIAEMDRVIPRDNALLTAFVNYAAAHGVPARWYYINKSKGLLINMLRACIARDLVGYEAFVEILNSEDPTVSKALRELSAGNSPTQIKP
ncbi:MAG: S41 family peptidase [Muribaculaceae bacterium]|nr:S41 family peptidase [Muribaculaceae bacterium]